jgi:hypothetical protein
MGHSRSFFFMPIGLPGCLNVALRAGLIVTLLSSVARADTWSLTTGDLQSRAVQLRSLSKEGVRFSISGEKLDQVIPLHDFVCMQRTELIAPTTRPDFILLLADGDRLIGKPLRVVDEQLIWLSPAMGELNIRLEQIQLISRGSNAVLPMAVLKEDIVTLSNGDSVAGIFNDCANEAISIQTNTSMRFVPIEKLKSIVFASSLAKATGVGNIESEGGYRVHLNDTSILTATSVTMDGDELTLVPTNKNAKNTAKSVKLPLDEVSQIEQINGPVNWLTAKLLTDNVQAAYLGGEDRWPARFDLSVDGSPLSFDGQLYEHGIGVHAYSRLTFSIDPQWAAFRTQYAIDSPLGWRRPYGDVTVRIKLDGKTVHEETHVNQCKLLPAVVVDCRGNKLLTLECDYGDAGDLQGSLNWLQPAFLRSLPSSVKPIGVNDAK